MRSDDAENVEEGSGGRGGDEVDRGQGEGGKGREGRKEEAEEGERGEGEGIEGEGGEMVKTHALEGFGVDGSASLVGEKIDGRLEETAHRVGQLGRELVERSEEAGGGCDGDVLECGEEREASDEASGSRRMSRVDRGVLPSFELGKQRPDVGAEFDETGVLKAETAQPQRLQRRPTLPQEVEQIRRTRPSFLPLHSRC